LPSGDKNWINRQTYFELFSWIVLSQMIPSLMGVAAKAVFSRTSYLNVVFIRVITTVPRAIGLKFHQ
jgi:hypothetical protein